ncbi:rhodanese-like domain-containing protein [Candidatus Shapirobacteria bacterium]|nr:rhodanese-like domain-containing protein [Candidatus Shapirobacteria bacterium]
MNKNILVVSLVALVFGILGGVAGAVGYSQWNQEKVNRVAEFYNDEMAVAVSPATLRKLIDDKATNFVVVDLRSEAEYKQEHIVGAVNIPAVSMNADQVVEAFEKLPAGKEVIVHCYSAYCTLSKQVGQTLAQHKIYVKELNIGWSEWKYYWGLWNPGEDPKNGKGYVVTGGGNEKPAPGICIKGEFGC